MGVVACPGHGSVWPGVDNDTPVPGGFAGFDVLPGPVSPVAWVITVAVWGVSAVNRCAVGGTESVVRCVRTQVAPRCLGCAWGVAR